MPSKQDYQCVNCNKELINCHCGETQGYSNHGAICPYCGHCNDPVEGDYILYDESIAEYDCDHCSKDFSVNLCLTQAWTTYRLEADQ